MVGKKQKNSSISQMQGVCLAASAASLALARCGRKKAGWAVASAAAGARTDINCCEDRAPLHLVFKVPCTTSDAECHSPCFEV